MKVDIAGFECEAPARSRPVFANRRVRVLALAMPEATGYALTQHRANNVWVAKP
jgi:hypothetical protein